MNGRFHCYALLCLLVIPATLRAQVVDPLIRSQIESWLKDSQLIENFTVAKLRFKSRENSPPVLQLEFRFIDNLATNQTDGATGLDRFLANYEKTNGISFYEKIFFKLLHYSGRKREEVSVHVHFLEEEYVASWDKTNRTFMVRRGDNRMIRRTLTLGLMTNASPNSSYSLRLRSDQVDSARLEKIVAGYFQNFRVDPPLQIQTAALELNYLHLEVRSLKNIVLPHRKFWESLTLSFDAKRQNDQMTIICHADGSFATGLGDQVPSRAAYRDMEPEFRADLESFITALLSHIGKSIEKP
jgi:hypothetical protein